MEFELFATKLFRREVRRGDFVKNSCVDAAQGIFLAPHLGDVRIIEEKYSTFSFEKEQKFLALANAKELENEVW